MKQSFFIPNFHQIKSMILSVENSTSKSQEVVKVKFERVASSFDGTLNFLIEIAFIKKTGTDLNFLGSREDKIIDDNKLEALILKQLAVNLPKVPLISHYIDQFKDINGDISYEPSSSDNIFFADARNLLIELKAIEYKLSERKYLITEKGITAGLQREVNRKISLEALQRILDRQSELGKNAELAIIKYEKNRLKSYPDLSEKVKRISPEDVAAGYDIKSREISGAERFIEVKAVSIHNFEFVWSINEVTTAEKLNKKYYLYLVPVDKNGLNVENLLIINNPHQEVFSNSDWTKSPSAYRVSKLVSKDLDRKENIM